MRAKSEERVHDPLDRITCYMLYVRCLVQLCVSHLLYEDIKQQFEICWAGHVFRVELNTART